MHTDNAEKLINASAADRLISAHDGDVALLYIYYSRIGRIDSEKAAAELCRTMNEIRAAEEKLRRMGLLPLDAVRAPAAAGAEKAATPVSTVRFVESPEPAGDERPQYTAADVEAAAKRDSNFTAVLNEATKVIGRSLSSPELKTLLNIYDNICLPCDVCMLLIHYCSEVNQEKYRGQRRLSVYAIEKEAIRWANQEIVTIDQAEEYISHAADRRSETAKIAAALNIHQRPLTKSEREYIEKWADMGFGSEVIAEAYDRTVVQTGKLNFRYLNAILERWKNNDLMTLREISEKDPPRSSANRRTPAEERSSTPVKNDLSKILDKMRG